MTSRTTALLAAAGLLAASTACTHSRVEEEWGNAYHENFAEMVADPAAELKNSVEPAPQGLDGNTGQQVMERYRASEAPSQEPSLPLPMIVTDTESAGSW